MIAGNGGSAADAQHLATEFLSRFVSDRRPLPAIALTTDTSALTAIGNDYGFEHVFERQLRALGSPRDVFLAISTSGRSPNVIAALRAAREIGMTTVGFTGRNPADMAGLCDLCLHGAVAGDRDHPADPHHRRAHRLRPGRARHRGGAVRAMSGGPCRRTRPRCSSTATA